MARKRENPADGPGLKKNTHCACREDNTPIRLSGQGFEASYPCRGCPYFQSVTFSRFKVRHMCGLQHVWLEASGRIDCTMMKRGGAA